MVSKSNDELNFDSVLLPCDLNLKDIQKLLSDTGDKLYDLGASVSEVAELKEAADLLKQAIWLNEMGKRNERAY